MVWKSWTALLLLVLCKSGADGPFSLPPSVESHPLKLLFITAGPMGHLFFFWHSVTNQILSPVLVMSPNTGVFYRSLSLSKMAISDKTGKPETGCTNSMYVSESLLITPEQGLVRADVGALFGLVRGHSYITVGPADVTD